MSTEREVHGPVAIPPFPPAEEPPQSCPVPVPAGERRRAIWSMLGVVLIWGVNLSVMKAALTEVSPLAFNALRFPLGTLALAFLVWRLEPAPWPRRDETMKMVALGVLAHPLYQFLFLTGLALTSASHTAVLVSTTPIWVALADRVVGRERLPWKAWAGIALSLIGVLIVIASRDAHRAGGVSQPSSTLGDAMVLCSSMLWTTYVIGSRPLLRSRSPLWVTSWAFFFGAPVIVLMGIPSLTRIDWHALTIRTWGGGVFAGLLALAVAYWWWAVGVQKLGPTRTAVFSNLIPIVALTFAWMWLGDTLSAASLAGSAVALTGVWITTATRSRGT